MIPTPGNLSQPRLPWLNPHVLGLLGKRDEKGERLLEMLHLELLAALAKALPTGEGTVTRAEISAWLGTSHPGTPRRLLSDLRRLGLIEYCPDCTLPAAWVAARRIVEIHQVNHIDSAQADLSTKTDEVNRRDSPSPKPPPDSSVTEGNTLLGMIHDPHTKHEDSLFPRARARETSGEGILGEPLTGWDLHREQIKDRRQEITGRRWLPAHEEAEFKALFAAGATVLLLDEAIAEWRGRLHDGAASPGPPGWRYVLAMVKSAVAEKDAPAPRTKPRRAPAQPKEQVVVPFRPHARLRQGERFETVDEAHERCMAELRMKNGWHPNGTDGRGIQGAQPDGQAPGQCPGG